MSGLRRLASHGWGRRSPLFLAAAFLLAVATALLLLSSAPAHAESEKVLMTNRGEPTVRAYDISDYTWIAQSFNTGGHQDGYELAGITIYGGNTRSSFSMTVTLRADNNGSPSSTVLATFDSPSSWTDGANRFTPQNHVRLMRYTKYWVHMNEPRDGIEADHTLSTGRWDRAAVESYWYFGDTCNSDGSCTNELGIFQMAFHGEANPNPPPRPVAPLGPIAPPAPSIDGVHVGNMDRTALLGDVIDVNVVGHGGQVSQPFATGPNPDGYLLDEIVLVGNTDRSGSPRVTLRTDDNGTPSDVVVARLRKTGERDRNWTRSENVFLPNGPAPLRANTTYHIHLDAGGAILADAVDHADGLDADGSGGWTLGKWQKRTASGWAEHADNSLRVAVRATVRNSRVLLSNFGAARSSDDFDLSKSSQSPYFIGFFPGGNAEGYYLTALELLLGPSPNPGNSLKVELWRDYEDDGILQPQAKVATFANPDAWKVATFANPDAWVEGVNVLTLPEAVWLQPSPADKGRGKYFIKFVSVTGTLPLIRTNSLKHEDPTNAPGWESRASLYTDSQGEGRASDLTFSLLHRLHGRINEGGASLVDDVAKPNRITDLRILSQSTVDSKTYYVTDWTNPTGGTLSAWQFGKRNLTAGWGNFIWVGLAGTHESGSYSLRLDSDSDYEIHVRVKVDGVYSAASNTVRTNPSTPGAPFYLTARAAPDGDGRVTLEWEPPFDGGAPITEYQYRQKSNNESVWQYWQDMSGSSFRTLSYTLPTRPNPNDKVDFQMRAVNAEGEGEGAAATVEPLFRPRPVTDLTASVVLPLSPTGAAWSATMVADHTGYCLQYGCVPSDFIPWQGFGSLTNDEFSLGPTGYRVISLRYGEQGGSAPIPHRYHLTVPSLHLTLDKELSAVDKDQMVLHVGSREFALADASVNQREVGDNYNYSWRNPDKPWNPDDVVQVSLYHLTLYHKGFDLGVQPSWSAPDGGPDIAKYQYQMRQWDPNSKEIPWGRYIGPEDADGNYWVDAAGWHDIPGGASARNHRVTGLEEGKSYVFRVRAVGAEGRSGWPSNMAAETPRPLPQAPDLAISNGPGARKATLEWTKVPHVTRGYEYRVRAGAGAYGAWTAMKGSDVSPHNGGAWNALPDSLRHVVRDLTAGTRYTFQARGRNNAGHGEGEPSNEVNLTPKATLDPAVRINSLEATSQNGRVTFTWAVSEDSNNLPRQYEFYWYEPILPPAVPPCRPDTAPCHLGANHFRWGEWSGHRTMHSDERDDPWPQVVEIAGGKMRMEFTTTDITSVMRRHSPYSFDSPGSETLYPAGEERNFGIIDRTNDLWSNDVTLRVDASGGATHESTPFNLANRRFYSTNNPLFVEGGTGVAVRRSVVVGKNAGSPVGAPVSAVYPKGDATGDSVTYTLKGADAGSFNIDSDSGQVRTAPGVTYNAQAKSSYAVKVKALAQQSAASAEVDVTIRVDEGGGAPAPADFVSAVAEGESRIDLFWTVPSGEPTSYEVEWSADGETGWTAVDPAHSGTDTTYRHTGLPAGTTYHYRVRGLNEVGAGAWSEPVSAATDSTPTTPATGAPAITGTVRVGETLIADTAGIADEDGLDIVVFAYQWLAGGAEIAGATGSTYTLVDADEGKAISVTVSFTDDAGNAESLTSEARAPNIPATGAPAITGTVRVGETLTADTSGIADEDGLDIVVFAYRWLAAGAEIAGANGSTYTLVDADAGKAISVTVSFTDNAGNAESLTSEARAPNWYEPILPPAVPPCRPDTAPCHLGANHFRWGEWSGHRTMHSDERDDPWPQVVEIAGGKMRMEFTTTDITSVMRRHSPYSFDSPGSETLYPAGEERNFGIIDRTNDLWSNDVTLRVDASGGATHESTPFNLANRRFYSTNNPLFVEGGTGVAVRRSVVVGKNAGSPVGAPVSAVYPKGDATGDSVTYTLKGADAGSFNIDSDSGQVRTAPGVTYNAQAKSSYAVKVKALAQQSAASAEVDVTIRVDEGGGAPAPADFVSAVAEGESRIDLFWTVPSGEPTSYEVEWSADGETGWTAVDPAHSGTDTTYRHTGLPAGTTYHYRVRGLNEVGAGAWSEPVSAATDSTPTTPATGAPAITGTVRVGETLIADTAGIADEDGLDIVVFAYQWLAGGAEIAGATGSTYTLVDADEGKAISVTVSFTDDAGNAESLTSEARAPNIPATGAPAITGTVRVGETLTADTSGIADEDGLDIVVFAYRWLAAGAEIAGANGSTYTLVDADAGKAISVTVSFTDNAGNAESLTSEARAPNIPATGAPAITGTARVWEMLTADTSGIADENGLDNAVFAYRWLADGEEKSRATGKRYTLAAGDAGRAISVRVSFTDDDGNEETLTSAAVALDPDDYTMNVIWEVGTHGVIPVGGSATGVVEVPGDRDFFAVNLSKGQTYRIDVAGHGDADALEQVRLHGVFLYAEELECSGAYEDPGVTTYVLTAGHSEVYSELYSVAVGAAGDGTGGYRVSVAESGDTGVGCDTAPVAAAQAANTPATGAPAITGTVRVGETLTADTSGIADEDGLDNASFSYQWQADGAEISGATGNAYTLAGSDEGKAISVKVSFTDNAGNDESLTSAATDAVEPGTEEAQAANSPATGAPAVTGAAQVGETLAADTSGIADDDGLDKASFSYQWFSNDGNADTDIQDATASTYTLVDADIGRTIKVTVSFTDGEGNAETLTSAATDAVEAKPNTPATGAPIIVGTVQVGETLTADTSGIADDDGLTNAAFAYQWIANDGSADSEMDGATGSTYTLAPEDEGNTVSVTVSFTDDAGHSETLTSAATAAVEAKANNPATGAPAIGGTAQVGETLTADTSGIGDDDGLDNAVFSYQWLADGAALSGATVETYTLADADIGKAMSVKVSFTDDAGNDETLTSAATAAVEARPNSPATGAPTISGTAQVGETLKAETSGIADADGLSNATFAYQWLADGAEISGATASAYTLAGADEGAAISITVSFTDGGGNEESLASAATGAVEAKSNSPATGQPAISGAALVGETLTAGTSGISDADGLTNAVFSYQWLADGADISGATASTYTPVDADEGKAVSVTVSFTDDAGNEEESTSAATDAVEAGPNSPATGVPTITGTAQAGETLTADTSGIEDADGLADASYSYQWLAKDAEISGATDSTYTLASDDVGRTIRVRVSFTDDRGHGEELTSAATEAVAGLPSLPLTASLENAATSHDGESVFTFELRFSEEFGISYKTLRDHAFTVTGGTVKKAQRLEQGSNIGWRITVRPDGNGDVTVVLPETTDCDDQGAICTEDGRMLSHRLELTVSGPGQ